VVRIFARKSTVQMVPLSWLRLVHHRPTVAPASSTAPAAATFSASSTQVAATAVIAA